MTLRQDSESDPLADFRFSGQSPSWIFLSSYKGAAWMSLVRTMWGCRGYNHENDALGSGAILICMLKKRLIMYGIR